MIPLHVARRTRACSRRLLAGAWEMVERHVEEEPQHRHGRVDGWWLKTGLGQVQLERTQVFGSGGVGDRPRKAASVLTARM
jgi:hypothetical protein